MCKIAIKVVRSGAKSRKNKWKRKSDDILRKTFIKRESKKGEGNFLEGGGRKGVG